MARVWLALASVWLSACGGRAQLLDSSIGGMATGVARGGASAQGGASGVAAAGPSFAGSTSTGGASSSAAGASSAGAANVGPGISGEHPRAQVKFADCKFSPLSGPAAAPFAPPSNVRGRLEQFINVLPLMQPGLPAETTPGWAASQMAQLIDADAAQHRAGDGLTDFLQVWSKMSKGLPGSLDGWHPFAQDWAYFSELADFTLADMLAGSVTGQPHRVGIFTDPTFVQQLPRSAPRGAALLSALFCASVPPPPPNVPTIPPTPGAGQTFRESYSAELASSVCIACHSQMDPLGFSLEHFGPDGSYRDLDNGQPVDSSGSYNSPGGSSFMFNSIEAQLAVDVSSSCEVARCFAEAELEYALHVNGMLPAGEALPNDSPDVNQVAQQFADSGRNMRALALAIAQSALLLK